MRITNTQDNLTALAVAGSYVTLLGWDMPKECILEQRVLGFAIERQRHSDGEVIWLSGMKTFQSVEPNPAPGVPVSTFKHPLQTFQWSDYSVSPGITYTYRIVARCGHPKSLTPGSSITLTVTTEAVEQGRHAIHFNRGAIASQEYSRRFQSLTPDEVGKAAYNWLSRGLLEAIEGFIAQTKKGDELHGAFYEFKNHRIYTQLKLAKKRGVKLKILYDGDSQKKRNEEELLHSGIKSLTKARTHSGGCAHNKFLVWVRKGKAQEVLTGSTNLSQNGIFGHSNNIHIVRDMDIAQSFEEYWQILYRDLTRKPTAIAVEKLGTRPPQPWDEETVSVFSPRNDCTVLDWYADLANAAERGIFATFAFGMNTRFVDVYDQEDAVLRFALMERKGNGRNYKKQAAEINRIKKLKNVTIGLGCNIQVNSFDRWLAEIESIIPNKNKRHVTYIHTKYMLLDPLGENPIVITGSANFSKSSTNTNDENMLVIRGNKAVADIYLGEFMRLFTHYSFRNSLQYRDSQTPAAGQAYKYLLESPRWINGAYGKKSGYFHEGTDRALRRKYFSGQ